MNEQEVWDMEERYFGTRWSYRAAVWYTDDMQGWICLTAPEDAHLPDDQLLVEARAEAEREGLDLSSGRIIIEPFTP